MTISSTTAKAGPFSGNGVTTAFPFAFKQFAKTDLKVVKTSTAGVDSTLVLDSDYSVVLNVDQNVNPGGTVTTLGTPLAGGGTPEKLTLVSNVPDLQQAQLTNGGGFFPGVINDIADTRTIVSHQNKEKLDRALVQPVSDVTAISDLPSAVARALMFLAFDASGNPIPSGGTASVAVSSAMAPVVASATLLAGRQTLLLDKHGADIASAATVNLDTATGDFVNVTGVVTITAITLADGVEKVVRFTGALTLTNGASLVLPGSADFVTAAGDFLRFRGDAAGVVRCVGFLRAGDPTLRPAFSAHRNGVNQVAMVTAAYTKVQFTTKTFDTNTEFDAVTNFRHTPKVPGKWIYVLRVALTAITDGKFLGAAIYKNSALDAQKFDQAGATQAAFAEVTSIVDMNGTTDFVEGYLFNGDTSNQTLDGQSPSTRLYGVRVGP